MRPLGLSLALVLLSALPTAAAPRWQRGAPVPAARTEVAAAAFGREIAVVGGFLANGNSTGRADAYSPATDRWRQLLNLPVLVNHAMATDYRGRLYVVGGYGEEGALRTAFVLERGAWRALPPMPEPRAAAGAVIAAGKLYVVGGVGPGGLARRAFAFDLRTRRWTTLPGPTPREHLGAAALKGRVYAVAGRTAGLDTNVDLFEVYLPARRRWLRLPRVPDRRGGTAAAALGNLVVSAGGEEPQGTIASVYEFSLVTRRWRRLPDLPTPRHGLGLVAFGGRVYALAGGPRPGLHVSAANEYLEK